MANDRSIDTSCAVCGVRNEVMKRCTRCRSVFYCSRPCQVSDWTKHKFLCADVPAELQPADDTPDAPAASNAHEPLNSGIRILPDGGYESFLDGKLLGPDGFPTRSAAFDATPKRVVPCGRCSGTGVSKSSCEGVVRQAYCEDCNGDGCIVREEIGKDRTVHESVGTSLAGDAASTFVVPEASLGDDNTLTDPTTFDLLD
eukprot:CAMPEP_0180187658 /NCGR_PEP_ID=MMETSP0986-20121125/43664_1 /TAXON_ID=697907 /ORGANISM="non described non described, Strain CCMP2293" /LENGTH=199 /DNA_ID=CAMNT_0022141803 /DNA_START=131 /DNA_END=729 /DNA_ORIENTATION=-